MLAPRPVPPADQPRNPATSTSGGRAPPRTLLAHLLPKETGPKDQPGELPKATGPKDQPAPDPGVSQVVGLAPLSAQCPACSLHALVAVHLRRDGKTGRWRQLPAKESPGPQDLTLDTCPVCFGVWLDHGELDALGDADVDPAFLKTMVGRSAGRMCPRGHGFMNEHQLPDMRTTPLDRCPRCRGLWLDGDERHRLARSTTPEGQEEAALRLAKRGLIWAAQVLTQLPIEVDNPRRGPPWALLGLSALLVVTYVCSVYGVLIARHWALFPAQLAAEPLRAYTALTHLFFHADWFHLLWNLYFLYVFGGNVEHVYGRRRFLLLFFGAGVFGGALQAFLSQTSPMPVVGASGAIAGVCGAYLVIFPRARLLQTLPLVYVQIKIRAWVYLCAWIGFQAVMALWSAAHQFAWFAHIGGFALGAAVTPLVLRSVVQEVGETVRVRSAAAIFGKVPRRRGPPIVVAKIGTSGQAPRTPRA